MPSSADAIVPELLGQSGTAKATVALDAAASKAIITVTNASGNDVDGTSTHTYTIAFAGGDTPEPTSASVYTGSLVIEMMGSVINEGDETVYTVYITPTGDSTCDFSLPNFSLDLGDGPTPLGDINVENVTMTSNSDGTVTYSGTKQNLSLLDGEIIADVNLNGTEQADGSLSMQIAVIWKAGDDENIPINVTFNGQKQSSGISSVATDDTQAPVEYYNLQGIRVNNPAAGGVYIRRQGSTVSKVLVK
jgi:hypothetical protein